MVHNPNTPTVLYVTNPMCAWCYAFTGVVRRLAALWNGNIQVQVLTGDFQAYATEPLELADKQRLAVNWHSVQERTSLPFNYSFFTLDQFVYRTAPVCRALLCAKLLRPVLTLEVLRAFHSAFFADGVNITELPEIVRIVQLFGIPENLFLTLYESGEVTMQLNDEFELSDRVGATTFPSLFLKSSHGYQLITKGYCDLNELEQRLLQELHIR
jgi:putative protein-disulfide isomerase